MSAGSAAGWARSPQIGRVGGSDQGMLGPRHDVHHPPIVGSRQDDGPVAEPDLFAS